jgi:hypothetical protein
MAMKKHGVATGKSKLQMEKDAGRYSDIKKKLFKHNPELDKQKVSTEVVKVKPATDHYHVDKEWLEEIMPAEKRTSNYWQPDENVYDTILLQKLVRNINTVARYIVGRTVGVQFSETSGGIDNYSGEKLVVSLGALLDHRIPFHMRLDVTTALAINKAFGAKYTTPGVERLLIANGLVKNKIAKFGFIKTQKVADFDQSDRLFTHGFQKYLLNAVEDARIEHLGLEKYSGYVYYMEAMRKYAYWCHLNMLAYPAVKPNWSNPDDFYRALTMYINYKSLMPEILPEFTRYAPSDSKFKDLMKQVDDILSKPAKTFDDSMAQSKKLLDLYPREQQDKQEEKAGGKGKGKPGPTAMEGTPADGKMQKGKFDKDAKETIEDVIDDEQDDAQTEDHEIDIQDRMSRTDDYEKVHVVPAPEGTFDPNVYREAQEIAKQISKNLSFLDSRFNRTQQMFEMRSGEIDEDEIFSLKFNRDIFWEEEEAPGYSMDFGILVDESGSMGGNKIRSAQIAALGLALALKDNPHINLFVYGHTANTGNHPITMYRYFDPMEKGTQNINTMFSIHARANNADGYAIAHMGDVLAKGRAKQKVLVVASDGYPSASGYGGAPGIKHTAKMVQKLEVAGVFVVQIALEHLNSAEMFQHFIPYDKNSLGVNLKKVLVKKLVEISNSI